MVARPWSSSRLSCGERLLLDATGTPGILFRARWERITPLELGGGKGALLDVGGTLLLPLEWSRVCRVLLELQQGCEGPFGSSRG